MAIVTEVLRAGRFNMIWQIMVTDPAEAEEVLDVTSLTIDGAALHVSIVPMTATGVFSAWRVLGTDFGQIVLQKNTDPGTEENEFQVRVSAWVFHSIND